MLKAGQGLENAAAIPRFSRLLIGYPVFLRQGTLPKLQNGSSEARFKSVLILLHRMRLFQILNSLIADQVIENEYVQRGSAIVRSCWYCKIQRISIALQLSEMLQT